MSQHSIIFFDGVCNFCNSRVQFVIRRDNTNYFLFASLQTEEKKILAENNPIVHEMNSFILPENGKVYGRSTAALKVVRKLKSLWRFLYSFIIFPKFIRDGIYQIISKKMYRWFGNKNERMIITSGSGPGFLN